MPLELARRQRGGIFGSQDSRFGAFQQARQGSPHGFGNGRKFARERRQAGLGTFRVKRVSDHIGGGIARAGEQASIRAEQIEYGFHAALQQGLRFEVAALGLMDAFLALQMAQTRYGIGSGFDAPKLSFA